jgi:nitroreductase
MLKRLNEWSMCMDVERAIRERKSIRAFKDDPVPDMLLRSIINSALLAPSWGNTQPWEVFVVTGKKLVQLKKAFANKFETNQPTNPDFPLPTEWPEECLRRHKALGKALFAKIGIRRDDHARRKEHYLQMFQGFGAPVFVYMCLDKKLTNWAMLDVGIFIQTVCLVAISKGVSSCILTHLVLYPDIIRKELQISENKYMVMGIALGYPDEAAEINAFSSHRENQSDMVKWIS